MTCPRCGAFTAAWRWRDTWVRRCTVCGLEFTGRETMHAVWQRWTLGDQDAEIDPISKRFAGIEVD